MRISVVFYMFGLWAFAANSAFGGDRYLCRSVGKNWVWFSGHIAVSVGPEGRTYEVGTGISISSSPWGRRKKYSGSAKFAVYGAGALHIRKADSGKGFRVCASSSGLRSITIIQKEF